jgi:F-type H+-transporting ATPase subunit b
MRQKHLAMVCLAAGLFFGGAALAAAPGGGPAHTTTAAVEAAAGHEGKGEAPLDPVKEETQGALGTMIVTVVVFLCLFGVLGRFAWKPILTGLKNREQAIRDSIEAAKRAKEAADKTARDLEAKMADIQRQAAAQLQQAKADALKVAESIRAQAEAESAALKDRTLREIDAAKQHAVGEINAHAAELGTAVARKILQRNVTVEDQQRLVDESLAELAKKN